MVGVGKKAECNFHLKSEYSARCETVIYHFNTGTERLSSQNVITLISSPLCDMACKLVFSESSLMTTVTGRGLTCSLNNQYKDN